MRLQLVPLVSAIIFITVVHAASVNRPDNGQAEAPGRPALLKTARLNLNQTRLLSATTPRTPDAACQCRPEEFVCPTPSGANNNNNNNRRKGQLAFSVKKANSTASGKGGNVLSVQHLGSIGGQSTCSCIPLAWVCDGNADCEGGHDEAECGEGDPCRGIRCKTGSDGGTTLSCIQLEWMCDGDNDCADGSDEMHCDHGNATNATTNATTSSGQCTSTSFYCSKPGPTTSSSTSGGTTNGPCIPQVWVCDGDPDCEDGSDERDCAALLSRTCSSGQHRCGNGACIPADWRCDGDPDCSDQSDETGCPSTSDGSRDAGKGADGLADRECADDEFQCASGHCIRAIYRCDGEVQCRDVSDELDCGTALPRCLEGDFRCPDGQCIAQSWRCDGEADCEPGVDEENCDSNSGPLTCGPRQVSCSALGNGTSTTTTPTSATTAKNATFGHGPCVSTAWVCDGERDCPDGQDEMGCPANYCGKDQFACSNDTCVGFSNVCNGEHDCPNGEDELDCTVQKECDAHSRCQHTCLLLSNGTSTCGCRSGYRLTSDGVSCVDVDECATWSYCSQLCTNTIGGFGCSCVDGYVLRPDATSCKALGPPVRLVFANRIDIRQVSLYEEEYASVIDGLQNAIALDFHYKKSMVVWSDVTLDAIKRAHFNGTALSDAVFSGLKSPGGIAVDWVHDNLYWTDAGVRRIDVSLLDGSWRRTLIWQNVEKPRAIAVHPGAAVLVWTDWGLEPRIERSDLDGSRRSVLVSKDVVWPNGLTIDYTIDFVYWADAKHHVIECIRIDGTGRRRVIDRGLPHPFAITVFEDSVFWTDWHTKSIHQANKLTGHDSRTVRTNLHFPMDIHSVHPLRQPDFTNRCGSNRGGCSHLCLPNRDGYTCACPPGLKMLPGGKTCENKPGEMLVFAQKSELRLLPLGGATNGTVDHVLPLSGVRSAVALDWDSTSETIFWTDVEADVINRAFWNGSNQQTVVGNDLESPAGLAVDWVTSKLYWTDAGTNRIEVSRLDGSMRSLLIWEGLDRPRDIVVDPIGGFMYWTDWGQTPKIERAGMDGSQRSVIVSSNLTWPNGLAIDHDAERLYWADGGTKAIEYASLDGSNRTILIGSELPHPFGLALYDNQIFWTDWDTTAIHSTDKLNGKRRTIVRSGLDDLMDVRVYHQNRQLVPSLCKSQNGGCSHLCLLAPLPLGHTCACPTGIRLKEDDRTCRSAPSASIVFSQRSKLRRISLDMPYTTDIVLDLPAQKNAVALDVDRVTGAILWSDTTQDKIFMATDQNGAWNVEVVAYNLDTVEGLAIDEINRKIYWTDAGKSSLEVAELDARGAGRHRKVLIWMSMDQPRGLVLSHETGLMFWTDWGKQPRIEQADMDGGNRKTLIGSDLGWPNSLVIDHVTRTLFWTDAKKGKIEACGLNGAGRRDVVTGLGHPYGIGYLDGAIYWTDWEAKALQKYHFESNVRSTVRAGLEHLMDVTAYREHNVTSTRNPCGTNNGGCSHLCLRSPWGRGFTCACPTGILMSPDGSTCQPSPNAFLLYATKNTLSSISLDTADQWDVALNVPGVQNAIGVDFHWSRQKFFYTDVFLDVIRSVDARNVSNVDTLVSTNLTTPDGLAVDWLADNLYWTDAGRNVLEVARLDGTSRKVIVGSGLDDPRAVAVFPQKGLLYWTDWGKSHKIERSFLDGSHRIAIVTSELGWPNGLAIDYEGQRLYWADAQLNRIETADLSGRYRVQLVQGASHPFGLTQYGAYLYWTDWQSKSIERVDKATGKQRSVLRQGLEGLMEIRAVAKEKQLGKNPCSDARNGGCMHLCLFRATSYVCACPDEPDSIACNPSTINVSIIEDYWSPALDPYEYDTDKMGNPYAGHYPYDVTGGGGKAGVHQTIVVLLVVGSIVLLGAVGVVFLKWQRRRFRDCPWNAGGRQQRNVPVLTFTNPNYSPSAPDVVTGEKKTFSWQRWKYDRHQERVYDMQDEKASHTEAASLIPHSQLPPEAEIELEPETEVMESSSAPSVTPPPTPPQRLDSICLE